MCHHISTGLYHEFRYFGGGGRQNYRLCRGFTVPETMRNTALQSTMFHTPTRPILQGLGNETGKLKKKKKN
jgi:hypothetical protein